MSERTIIKEFDRLSRSLLFFCILICLLLIGLTYYSFATAYVYLKATDDDFSASVAYNGIQTDPTTQPVLQLTLSSKFPSYLFIRFNESDFTKRYVSYNKTASFTRSFLLPSTLFGKNLTIIVGRTEPYTEETLVVAVVDGPEMTPKIKIS